MKWYENPSVNILEGFRIVLMLQWHTRPLTHIKRTHPRPYINLSKGRTYNMVWVDQRGQVTNRHQKVVELRVKTSLSFANWPIHYKVSESPAKLLIENSGAVTFYVHFFEGFPGPMHGYTVLILALDIHTFFHFIIIIVIIILRAFVSVFIRRPLAERWGSAKKEPAHNKANGRLKFALSINSGFCHLWSKR